MVAALVETKSGVKSKFMIYTFLSLFTQIVAFLFKKKNFAALLIFNANNAWKIEDAFFSSSGSL